MDWRLLGLALPDGAALQSTQGAIPKKEEEAMHAISQSGTAEHRVRQAIEEEAVRRHRDIPWGLIFETVFALIALAALVWSLFRS